MLDGFRTAYNKKLVNSKNNKKENEETKNAKLIASKLLDYSKEISEMTRRERITGLLYSYWES